MCVLILKIIDVGTIIAKEVPMAKVHKISHCSKPKAKLNNVKKNWEQIINPPPIPKSPAMKPVTTAEWQLTPLQ